MASRAGNPGVDVVVETGQKRLFVSAVDWPGWSRSVKAADGESAALLALAAYAPRYRVVADRAGLGRAFAAVVETPTWRVVEQGAGDTTTDFGAPSQPASVEDKALRADAAQRLVDLLDASWEILDEVASSAPAQLRKGPRGGGRDRDAVVTHVMNAEAAYSRKLGLRKVATLDPADRQAVEEFRARVRAALLDLLPLGSTEASAWSPRYLVRRMAWHVLDHVWEIEDRSE
jgi:hypothetical protein